MKITINKWDSFQLRKDVKSSSWFRFEHNFFTDHKFFTLDNDEKIIWINILCTASIESSDEIEFNLELCSRLTNVKVQKIEKTLQKLQSFQCLELHTRERNVEDTSTCLQTDRQTDRQTEKFPEEIMELWNAGASKIGLSQIRTLSPSRRKKLKEATREFKTREDWRKIFSVAANKGFTNKDGNTWQPDFNWILKNENYIKLYEEYDLMFKEKPKDETELVKQTEDILYQELGLK